MHSPGGGFWRSSDGGCCRHVAAFVSLLRYRPCLWWFEGRARMIVFAGPASRFALLGLCWVGNDAPLFRLLPLPQLRRWEVLCEDKSTYLNPNHLLFILLERSSLVRLTSFSVLTPTLEFWTGFRFTLLLDLLSIPCFGKPLREDGNTSHHLNRR